MGEVSSAWLVGNYGVQLVKVDLPERLAIFAERVEQMVIVGVAEIHGQTRASSP